jgi:hypothetical protein
MMTSSHPFLTRLEEKYDAHFTYDPKTKTWCLSGPFRNGAYDLHGLYWTTDNRPAMTFEDAEQQAIVFLQDQQEPTVDPLDCRYDISRHIPSGDVFLLQYCSTWRTNDCVGFTYTLCYGPLHHGDYGHQASHSLAASGGVAPAPCSAVGSNSAAPLGHLADARR